MRILIDEQLLGCGSLLRSIGYDVVLSNETGFQKDETLVEYAIEHSLFVITEDNGMATLCKFRNVPHLHLDVSLKTRVIVEELRNRNIPVDRDPRHDSGGRNRNLSKRLPREL